MVEIGICNKIPISMNDLVEQNVIIDDDVGWFCCSALLWSIWKWRNGTTFREKFMFKLDQVILSTMGYLKLWLILLNADKQAKVEKAWELMKFKEDH